MKKSVIIVLSIFLVLVVLLAGTIGAGAWYLYKERPSNALKYNSIQYGQLDNLELLAFKTKYNGQVKILTGIKEYDDAYANASTSESYAFDKKYTFNGNDIFEEVKTEGGTNPEPTQNPGTARTKEDLYSSDFFFMVFKNQDLWSEIHANDKYTVEEITLDNKKTWKIILKPESTKTIFIEGLKASIINDLNSSSNTKYNPDEITSELKGDILLNFYIDQASKDLTKVEYGFTDELKLNLGKSISKEFAQSFNANPDELSVSLILDKTYKQENNLTERKLKDSAKRFDMLNNNEKYTLTLF